MITVRKWCLQAKILQALRVKSSFATFANNCSPFKAFVKTAWTTSSLSKLRRTKAGKNDWIRGFCSHCFYNTTTLDVAAVLGVVNVFAVSFFSSMHLQASIVFAPSKDFGPMSVDACFCKMALVLTVGCEPTPLVLCFRGAFFPLRVTVGFDFFFGGVLGSFSV